MEKNKDIESLTPYIEEVWTDSAVEDYIETGMIRPINLMVHEREITGDQIKSASEDVYHSAVKDIYNKEIEPIREMLSEFLAKQIPDSEGEVKGKLEKYQVTDYDVHDFIEASLMRGD